jgi:hypothetical protein
VARVGGGAAGAAGARAGGLAAEGDGLQRAEQQGEERARVPRAGDARADARTWLSLVCRVIAISGEQSGCLLRPDAALAARAGGGGGSIVRQCEPAACASAARRSRSGSGRGRQVSRDGRSRTRAGRPPTQRPGEPQAQLPHKDGHQRRDSDRALAAVQRGLPSSWRLRCSGPALGRCRHMAPTSGWLAAQAPLAVCRESQVRCQCRHVCCDDDD